MNGVLKTTVATTNANITGLTSGIFYTFHVKAKDSQGNLSVDSRPNTAILCECYMLKK